MKEQISDGIQKTLQKSWKLLMGLFTLISIIGFVLFLLAIGGVISAAIAVAYAVGGFLLYLIILYHQFQKGIGKADSTIYWYEHVLDSLPFLVTITDKNRNWTFINQGLEQAIGKKRKEIIGQQCNSSKVSICDTPNCAINRLERGESQTFFQQMGMDLQAYTTYLHDENKNKIGHLEVVQDITKMKSVQRTQTKLIDQIRDMCDDFVHASSDLLNASQSLADSSSNQADAVENLFTLINETTDNVKNTANEIQKASKHMEEVGREVKITDNEMHTMVDAMNEITKSSKQIEMITKSIEAIASQTNLLSLNASIEAARAGESGRGFAVVADEIGELAKQSAEAARNTGELITKSITIIENGTRLASQTKESLNSFIDKISMVVSNVENISKTSISQAGAMDQINQGVEKISDVIQHNSATAQETASISNVLNKQTTELNELVNNFNKLVL